MEKMTDTQRKAYDKGWKSGQTPTYTKVEAADSRRVHPYWYLGYFDAEAGESKYTNVPTSN